VSISNKTRSFSQEGLGSSYKYFKNSEKRDSIPSTTGATIHEEDDFSKLTLFDAEIGIEFVISKATAGPILVPLFHYPKLADELERV
jgi:hypothetical protein